MKNRFGTWVDVQTLAHGHNTFYDYRIHPDDAHLAYGPISTALREAATQEIDYLQDATDVYGGAVIKDYENYGELGYCWDRARNSTTMHKSLFLLILAEALADSGL